MWPSLLPRLSTGAAMAAVRSGGAEVSPTLTRNWAGIQKSSFIVHTVAYNHSNPVRQCSMVAKDQFKNWKYYFFFLLPKSSLRQKVFLCQILSALCGLASQTGVTRCFIHVSKLALKVWPLVFSFSTCHVSSGFWRLRTVDHCWAAREKISFQVLCLVFVWVSCSSG